MINPVRSYTLLITLASMAALSLPAGATIPNVIWETTAHPAGGDTAVAFSPDGTRLATGADGDPDLKIWDGESGAWLLTLPGHADGVLSAEFSADGECLAVGYDLLSSSGGYLLHNGQTNLWNVETATLQSVFNGGYVGLSADGARVVSAGYGLNRDVMVHEASGGAMLAEINTGSYITAATSSPDGAVAVTGQYDGYVDLWRVTNGTLMRTLDHGGPVRALAFSPDGVLLATAGQSVPGALTDIKLWDADSGSLVQTLAADDTYISALDFSSDGSTLIVASSSTSYERLIRFWRVSDGSLMSTISAGDPAVTTVRFSPDASRYAFGRSDGAVGVAATPAGLINGRAYARAGWIAELSRLFHSVRGTVTILDENSLRADNFTYDGAAPSVYFYLGVEDSSPAFLNGLETMPGLTRAYSNETVFIELPPGQTLDGWNAVSVWCSEFHVNFGSGTFVAPPLAGDLNCDGIVNFGDIDPFVLAITAAGEYEIAYPDCDRLLADINGDGNPNNGDIDPFVALLGS